MIDNDNDDKNDDDKNDEITLPQAVPRNAHDLMLYRKVKASMSDVDRVETHFMAAIELSEYQSFADAMDGGTNVEGSLRSDDQEIARIVRNTAKNAGDTIVGKWPLDKVRRAVGSVMRRYSLNLMREKSAERAKAKS